MGSFYCVGIGESGDLVAVVECGLPMDVFDGMKTVVGCCGMWIAYGCV